MHAQDQGIGLADMPKALVFHEVLGAGMAITFWAVCMLPIWAQYGNEACKESSLEVTQSPIIESFLNL